MKVAGFELCTPAALYLLLNAVYLILSFFIHVKTITVCFLGMAGRGCNVTNSVSSLFGLGVETGFVMLWVWLLNFLCRKGFQVVSWILVLLPFVYLVAIADVRSY